MSPTGVDFLFFSTKQGSQAVAASASELNSGREARHVFGQSAGLFLHFTATLKLQPIPQHCSAPAASSVLLTVLCHLLTAQVVW